MTGRRVSSQPAPSHYVRQHDARGRVQDNTESNTPLSVERLREAQAFMAQIRDIQRESGWTLRGRSFLDDDVAEASRNTRQQSSLVRLVKWATDDQDVTDNLLEGFEEMCRRRKHPMPSRLRRDVYRLLALELHVNAAALGAPASDVARATIYNGDISGISHDPEFESLRETPGVFRRAAVDSPSDPKGLLRKVVATVADLERDAEFESLRESPWPVLVWRLHGRLPRRPVDPGCTIAGIG